MNKIKQLTETVKGFFNKLWTMNKFIAILITICVVKVTTVVLIALLSESTTILVGIGAYLLVRNWYTISAYLKSK